MEKLIITAAICGAEVTKAQNPAVPYTVCPSYFFPAKIERLPDKSRMETVLFRAA